MEHQVKEVKISTTLFN